MDIPNACPGKGQNQQGCQEAAGRQRTAIKVNRHNGFFASAMVISCRSRQRDHAEQAGAARSRRGGDVGGEAVHSGGGEEGEGEAFFGVSEDETGVGDERIMRFNRDGGEKLAQMVHDGAIVRAAASGDEAIRVARQVVAQGVGDGVGDEPSGGGEGVRGWEEAAWRRKSAT